MIYKERISLNIAFYNVLDKTGNQDIASKIIELIESKKENQTYWFSFGYMYWGLLEYKYGENVTEHIEKCEEVTNPEFIRKLVNLVYGEVLELNQSIVHEIKRGISQFISDFSLLKYEDIGDELVFAGIKYLSNNISVYDIKSIYEAVERIEVDGIDTFLPIIPREQHAFGLVYPWPGMNTAETELLARATKAAENIGFKCVMLSDFGEVLNEEQKETSEIIDGNDLDYVMTTHYESHKSIDAYYYHLLWNPPDIPLNVEYYADKVMDNYIMNDDYLIYDLGGMSDHLKSMLLNKPRTLEGASTFVGSFPKSVAMEPNLDNPKLFYCGMNWESVVSNSNRHEGLFKLLDKTEKIKFYGPDIVKEWGGIRPWDGYQCYQYSIPFDGFSILKEINSCGICLAISSDSHRRVGAVTNRAYEACAAGAVIISDNNIFMEKYFKDSVLYVTYNKNNPEDTFKQIMEKYQWIIENKEEALKMAKRSQDIFIERFCMEKGIIDATNNHFKRFKTIEKDLFANSEDKTVLATYVLNTQSKEEIDELLQPVIQNVCNQYYRRILVGIICDDTIVNEVIQYCGQLPCNIKVTSMNLFDEKGARCITNGQAIQNILADTSHDYYMNIGSDEIWFYDHVSTMVRTMEDSPEAYGTYAGVLSQDANGIRRTFFFETLKTATAYLQIHPKSLPVSGQFLFRKEAEEFVPDFVYSCLDGTEHVAYVNLLWFKYKKELTFTKRMTCVWKYEEYQTESCNVIDLQRQLRFIKGLVKYDLPNTGFEEINEPTIDISNFLLLIPIKQLLKLKIVRVFKRKFAYTRFGKKVDHKYNKIKKGYEDIMNTIS